MNDEERDKWEDENIEVIEMLLHEKACISAAFRTTLIDNTDKVLAECTHSLKWASALPKSVTEVTNPYYFPGKNMLGALLMDIPLQQLLQYEKEASDNSPPEDNEVTDNEDIDDKIEKTEIKEDDKVTVTPASSDRIRSNLSPQEKKKLKKAAKKAAR